MDKIAEKHGPRIRAAQGGIMRQLAVVLLAAALLAPVSARAYEPEAFPGSTWGNGTRDLNGFEGYGTQGWVRQGVQWLTFPGQITAKTFAAYNWRLRSQNRTYYDSRGPAVAIEFSKAFLDLGWEYSWQEFPQLDTRSENPAVYANWYKRYDLSVWQKRANILGLPVVGLPFSTWGRLSHDFNNLEGDGSQGYVRQAVEWVRLPGSVVLRTQASYNWRFRSKNRPYYNMHAPSAGAELGWKTVDLGIEYLWRSYPELSKNTRDFQLYLIWYFNWDLKRLPL